jgi:hypothetical protein
MHGVQKASKEMADQQTLEEASGYGGSHTTPEPLSPQPGQDPASRVRKGTPQAIHEQWTRDIAETSLSPRSGPGEPAGPMVGAAQYESLSGKRAFATPKAAFAAYDEALARSGGREVEIYRNVGSRKGEYIVMVGDEHSISPPRRHGNWESALHSHPNPENVSTRRMPASQDVSNTLDSAIHAQRPITAFIDYPMPDGRRGLVAYTVVNQYTAESQSSIRVPMVRL